MTNKWNLHTHCTYCDGKSTLEENVLKAISLGFLDLGFSSHAYTADENSEIELSLNDTSKYFNEIKELKDKYKDKINIYTGLEIDNLRPFLYEETEYSIGSIHFINTPQGLMSIDYKPEILNEIIQSFDGWKNFLIKYFSDMISFAKICNYDITGHFDLYTKFENHGTPLNLDFRTYKELALNTIEELVKMGKIIEINTGAISRGYKTKPYPDTFILNHLQQINAPIIISSDAHHADNLDCYFTETEQLLKSLNFKTLTRFTPSGFKQVKLI